MGLLGTYIDTRTLAGIAAAGSASFAHGLGSSPDAVFAFENTTTDSTGNVKIAIKWDATNVSLYNHGAVATATLRVTSILAHSTIR